MRTIIVRDVPDGVLATLDEYAAHAGQSRQELLLSILAAAAESHDPGLVVGFWETHGGEMHGAACAECGSPMPRVFVGMTRGYQLLGPFCERCATTE